MRRIWMAACLAAVAAMGMTFPAQASELFWSSDSGAVGAYRANLDGSDVTQVVTGADTGAVVDVNVYQNTLYTSDKVSGVIRASNLDGSNLHTLYSGQNLVQMMAKDTAGGRLFWTNYTDPAGTTGTEGAVMSGHLDGSGTPTELYQTPNHAAGIAYDPTTDMLFWTIQGSTADSNPNPPGIYTASADGSTAAPTLIHKAAAIYGMTLDATDQMLVWTNNKGNAIYASDLDGSNLVTLATDLDGPLGITYADGQLYWAERGASRIATASFDGSTLGPIQTVVSGSNIGRPFGVAAVVPEPASLALLGLGGMTLLVRRRRTVMA